MPEMSKKIDRRAAYKQRHRQNGLCIYCSARAVTKGLCLYHAVAAREWYRKKKPNAPMRQSKTRQLEKQFKPPPEFLNSV